MNKTLVIAAGYGNWAKNRTLTPFLQTYSSLVDLKLVTALFDPDREFKELKSLFKEVKVGADPILEVDYKEAFSRYANYLGPKAVVVNTPNSYHNEIAVEALSNGYHVYIERPAITHMDDIHQLIETARYNNRIVFTGTQRRLEDTYSYLHEVVKNKLEFNNLSKISCQLAVSENAEGWRKLRNLAGGGIILDSGYHLLDGAAWIISAAFKPFPEIVKASTFFDSPVSDEITERSTVGHVVFANKTLLSFDFSYDAPKNSIYEKVEIIDNHGARVTLVRDQTVRSTEPAKVTHQNHKGQFAKVQISENRFEEVNNYRFPGKANNIGPLLAFFQSINNPTYRYNNINDSELHPCDIKKSTNTWKIIKAIYETE